MEIPTDLNEIVKIIKNIKTSISKKIKLLFHLRNLKTSEASLCIQQCISRDSVLLDHEVAYVIGQLKNDNSIEFLFEIAEDITLNPIVRHEAIEALGNFENLALKPRLEIFLTNSNPIIKESAILAINKLINGNKKIGIYGTRDPSDPFEGSFDTAVKMFINGNLLEKYSAMFYFRNRNDKAAVETLLKGFEDKSDLLRHEVAFILGQMENEDSVDGLIKVLENEEEKDIVRHEAAEALGNIGNIKCLNILKKYLNSEIKIIRESVEVGLGIAELY